MEKLPSKIISMTGGDRAHPERVNKNEPAPVEKIGNAPRHLSEVQKAIWREIIEQVPMGVITKMDRMALELVCVLMDRFRKAAEPLTADMLSGDLAVPKMQGNELSTLMKGLQTLGMTPADRSRVSDGGGQGSKGDGWDHA